MATYEFIGIHFLASYIGCQKDLTDIDNLRITMRKAIEASGATILGHNEHIFTPMNGYTAVFVLSESHASIHTYPENDSCFVDLFTCGQNCSSEKFDHVLREFLQPSKVTYQVIMRNNDIILLNQNG